MAINLGTWCAVYGVCAYGVPLHRKLPAPNAIVRGWRSIARLLPAPGPIMRNAGAEPAPHPGHYCHHPQVCAHAGHTAAVRANGGLWGGNYGIPADST